MMCGYNKCAEHNNLLRKEEQTRLTVIQGPTVARHANCTAFDRWTKAVEHACFYRNPSSDIVAIAAAVPSDSTQ